jgi:hypothetical protein
MEKVEEVGCPKDNSGCGGKQEEFAVEVTVTATYFRSLRLSSSSYPTLFLSSSYST